MTSWPSGESAISEEQAISQIRELQKMNLDLAKELDTAKAELSQYKAQSSDTHPALAHLQSQLTQKEAEWGRMRQQLEARLQQIANSDSAAHRAEELQKKLLQAGNHLKALTVENANMAAKLQDVVDKEAEWKGKIQIAKEDGKREGLEDGRRDVQDLTSKVEELKKVIKEKESDVKNRDLELNRLKVIAEDDKREREAIEAQLNDQMKINVDLEERIKVMLQPNGNGTALNGTKEELSETNMSEKVKAQITKLQTELKASQQNFSILSSSISGALISLVANGEYHIDTVSIPSSVLSAFERLQAEFDRKAELIKKAKAEARAAEERLKSEHSKALVELQLQHNKTLESKAQIETELDSLTDKLENINALHEQTLATLRSEHDRTRAKHEKLESDYRGMIAKVGWLESEHEKALASLRAEFNKEAEEKKKLQMDHQALLEKVAGMKNALGSKLQADMEESSRLRQKVTTLVAENTEFVKIVEELKGQLAGVQEEYERTLRELERMRAHLIESQQEAAREVEIREEEARELRIRSEQMEREREDWELAIMEERSSKETIERKVRERELEVEAIKNEMDLLRAERFKEQESLQNLEAVLEEFQSSKDSEIRFAVDGLQAQLTAATTSLKEYQARTTKAEDQLERLQEDVKKVEALQREVKEKNLLIGKLRHEAVILNEHLLEALKRLRETGDGANVDRRLITNLILQFLNAPRGDRKRFEILQVMSSILQWTDEEKEQAGLIRKAGTSGSGSPSNPSTPGGWMNPRRSMDSELTTESFTDAFISFLLKETAPKDPNLLSPNSGNFSRKSSTDGL